MKQGGRKSRRWQPERSVWKRERRGEGLKGKEEVEVKSDGERERGGRCWEGCCGLRKTHMGQGNKRVMKKTQDVDADYDKKKKTNEMNFHSIHY